MTTASPQELQRARDIVQEILVKVLTDPWSDPLECLPERPEIDSEALELAYEYFVDHIKSSRKCECPCYERGFEEGQEEGTENYEPLRNEGYD